MRATTSSSNASLAEAASEFKPSRVAIADEAAAKKLKIEEAELAKRYTRFCPLYHLIVKAFDEPWRQIAGRFGSVHAKHLTPLGESLLFAGKRELLDTSASTDVRAGRFVSDFHWVPEPRVDSSEISPPWSRTIW